MVYPNVNYNLLNHKSTIRTKRKIKYKTEFINPSVFSAGEITDMFTVDGAESHFIQTLSRPCLATTATVELQIFFDRHHVHNLNRYNSFVYFDIAFNENRLIFLNKCETYIQKYRIKNTYLLYGPMPLALSIQ